MKYRKLETAILEAKRYNDMRTIDRIRYVLTRRKAIMDIKAADYLDDHIMTMPMYNAAFDKEYETMCKEYTQINRLFKIVDTYARG